MPALPYSKLTKGSFLIASPEIDEGIFFRSVVLLCDHSTVGSFGLIVNKTLEVEIPDEIISSQQFSNSKIQMRAGGPLQSNQMMLLHSSPAHSDQTLKVCTGVYLGGDLNFLQETAAKPDSPPLLLCFGYGGWGAGVLEREFLNGEWFLHPASSKHIFETPPEKMWQALLREMGGKYTTLSMIPDDLSLN